MNVNHINYEHKPVLLNEVIENLSIKKNGIYVDATFGRGGHSLEILRHLNDEGQLLVIDKDLSAIEEARKINDLRLKTAHCHFTKLKNLANELGWIGKIDGILVDLGVSSPQLDDASRGFSFLRDGPLDMRMDTSSGFTASYWINKASEKEMANVFKEYGEERFSNRIARAIVSERRNNPITTTLRLSDIVSNANPKREKGKHPATRVFQAIRIFVNSELKELDAFLEQSLEILAINGKLLVITFHSLEDRILKDFIRKNTGINSLPIQVPVMDAQIPAKIKVKGKAISPGEQEIALNSRARSAKLRVVEKIA